jgi:hypothetical protein
MQLRQTKEILNKFAKYVIQQSRTNLSKSKKNSSKSLYNSLDHKYKVVNGGIGIQFLMDEYGIYQDKGVRGANAYYADSATSQSPYSFKTSSKIPPVKTLADWAKRKNIRLRDKKGRYSKGNYNTIGFLIARSIKDKGIRASLFFTKPFEKAYKNLPKDLVKGFINDIEITIE